MGESLFHGEFGSIVKDSYLEIHHPQQRRQGAGDMTCAEDHHTLGSGHIDWEIAISGTFCALIGDDGGTVILGRQPQRTACLSTETRLHSLHSITPCRRNRGEEHRHLAAADHTNIVLEGGVQGILADLRAAALLQETKGFFNRAAFYCAAAYRACHQAVLTHQHL